MKETVTESQFINAMSEMRPGTFSEKGLTYLFEYLEDWEKDTGEETELDPIAICCDYTEFDSAQEVTNDYNIEIEDPEDILKEVEEYLQHRTSVICCEEDCILFAHF